jgi:dTDP-4-amino-4,6-dideoxygalactose transaminase
VVSTAIPYVAIGLQHASIKAELLAAVGEVIDGGRFILGEQVAEFERRFADLCGVRFAVGVNSGTDALILALRALGIGPGDEVITAPNSFVASAGAIRLAGGTPVFVDVDATYNLDPAGIAAAVTARTRAILPVHLTGRPCDMDPITRIADDRGLAVIEDCAQAVLAEYRGRRVGAIGAAGAFSLHPLKTLNACGDGGVVTTNDEAVFEQVTLTRNLGLKTRDNCVLWSSNSRLDTIQAAMLLVKLKYLEAWTLRRRALAVEYRRRLAGLSCVRLPAEERAGEIAVYHTFVIQAERRDALRAYLAERGIGSNVHYPVPIHLSDAARELGYTRGSFPVAEAQAGAIVSLPIYPELAEGDIDTVCTQIRNFYGER